MEVVYIVDACRTPIGKVNGALAAVRPDDLAAHIVAAVVKRNSVVQTTPIEDVYWGAANQSGEDNRNVGRMAALLAGLGIEVPGVTVNRLCGSGMQAVISAAQRIACGEADVLIAGGGESMTRAPFVIARPDRRFPRALEMEDSRLGWRFVNPAMRSLYPPLALGETAEVVARNHGVTREAQDEFALRSHRFAATAWESGELDGEVVPIGTPSGEVVRDESVDGELTLEDLARRRPAFAEDGSVTGGNSSPLSDGAAGLLLVSGAVAERLGITPLARYVGSTVAGVHPDVMGFGPVPATRALLDRLRWSVADLDIVEINEAFASQALACASALEVGDHQLNRRGGAIAIGHPLGCSGARLVGSAAWQLHAGGGRRAVATMCIGVGQGIAVALERP